MTGLINGEFEFRGTKFGSGRSGLPLKEGGFSIGATTFQIQDKDNSAGDGRFFGIDRLLGANYTFEMWVVKDENYQGWQAASRQISEFQGVWQGSPNRLIPRAVDELLLWHGDRPGLVYGRARNFAPGRDRLRRGYGSIICDFAAVDDMVYDEFMETVELTLGASSGGGFVAPFVFPLVGQGIGNRQGFFEVTGDVATPALVTFHGPCTNPRLTVTDSWTVGLATSLAYDQSITVDSRLWERSVLRKTGTSPALASAAGTLTRDTISLDQLTLLPGTHEAVFEAIDPTNTARVSLSWRNARHSV